MSPRLYARGCRTSPGSNRPISSACLPDTPSKGFSSDSVSRLTRSSSCSRAPCSTPHGSTIRSARPATSTCSPSPTARRRPSLRTIRRVCAQPVADDGLRFDTEDILRRTVRRGSHPWRFSGPDFGAAGHCHHPGPNRCRFRRRRGLPDPWKLEYPVLLDQPTPTLYAYPRETVAAEKFESHRCTRPREQPHEGLSTTFSRCRGSSRSTD